jgi:four helix bundle protein
MNYNSPPPKIAGKQFDHERLEVYRYELDFIEWVTPLLDEATASPKSRTREVCDQLDRASLSTLLNTAEGNGKRQRQIRAKFFDDARGSATECAACLDALVAKKIIPATRIGEGKNLLLKIVSMLSGLVNRFDGSSDILHEDSPEHVVN